MTKIKPRAAPKVGKPGNGRVGWNKHSALVKIKEDGSLGASRETGKCIRINEKGRKARKHHGQKGGGEVLTESIPRMCLKKYD